MSKHGESGYILASALAVLLSISLVAAALVSTSANGLRQVRNAEVEATNDAILRSALLAAGSQLALDPRRRRLQVTEGQTSMNVFGRTVDVRLGWESLKLDINRAGPEVVEELLVDNGIDATRRGEIGSAIQRHRTGQDPVRLLDDVIPAEASAACLHSVLTVFGGKADYEPGEDQLAPIIGRPAAGSRLWVELRLEGARGIAAVLLMTGDPAAPARILDWRRIGAKGGERCNENQK